MITLGISKNRAFGPLVCALFMLLLAACNPDGNSGLRVDLSSSDTTDAEGTNSSPLPVVDPNGNNATGTVDEANTANESLVPSSTSDDNYLLPFVNDMGAAGITDLILVTGQSNALGPETQFDPFLDGPHPRVFAFTNSGWQVADLHQVWDLNWHPRNDPDTDPSNNFGFQFARKVAARRPDRVIGFVLVTAPGMPINHWDYESAFYVKIRDRVVAAINELPHKATIDGVLWHQGETDWASSDTYTAKLDDLIRNFRGESWFGANRPFICGETAEAPVNERLMALNDDGDLWTGCVESEGVQTMLDGMHFTAEGLRIIGTRYATKYIQMTEQAD